MSGTGATSGGAGKADTTTDQRTLVAVMLALAGWYAYLLVFPPEPPPEEPEATPAPAAVAETDDDPVAPVGEVPVVDAPERTVQAALCDAELELWTRTGALRDVSLTTSEAPYDVTPVWRWALQGFPWPYSAYGEHPGPKVIASARASVLVASAGGLTDRVPPTALVEETGGRFVSRAVSPDGIEIVRTLSSSAGDPCVWEVDVTWTNQSGRLFTGPLWVGIHDVLEETTDSYDPKARPKAFAGGSLYTHDDLEPMTEPEPLDGEAGWFGIADKYFALLAVPDGRDDAGLWFSAIQRGDVLTHGAQYVISAVLPPGESMREHFAVYAGPKVTERLVAAAPPLEAAVELGWLAALASPMLWLLKLVHGAVGSWGWSIVGLTLLVKAALFPLTQASFKSTQAMQALQPELNALRERLASDPEALNREMMALFRDNGVNPLGGCLPMFAQMPVWIALYSALLSAVELYHTEFLYLKDLSRPDPYLVLPAIVVGLMVVQQQFMPTANMDPAQARMMKLMPLIFGVFFFTFPSGLVVYIFVNMVLSILQQWYIKRTFKPASGQVTGKD